MNKLLSATLLLLATSAHAAESTPFTVWLYGSGEAIVESLEAIKMMLKDRGFYSILTFIVLTSFLGIGAGAGLRLTNKWERTLAYLFAVLIFQTVFFQVKIDISVEDPVNGFGGEAGLVQDVPIGLALPAVVISEAGRGLTELIETYFTFAGYPEYATMTGSNQFNFIPQLMEDAAKARITNPIVAGNVRNFIQDCTVPRLFTGELSINEVYTSTDVWNTIQTADQARLTLVTESTSSSDTTELKKCSEAWTTIRDQVDVYVGAQLSTQGSTWKNTEVFSFMDGAIASSAAWLTGAAAGSGSDLVKRAAVANTFYDSRKQIAAVGGTGLIDQVAIEEAVAAQEKGWIIGAKVFARTIGYFFTVMQAFVFAMTPIVLLLVLVPGLGPKIGLNYLQIMIWLALWQPLLAIVSFLTATFLRGEIGDILASGVSLTTLPLLSERAARLVAAGNFLGTTVPMLAWGIVKTGQMGITQFIGDAAGPGHANRAAASAAAGNVNLDNQSIGNASMGKLNYQHSLTDGTAASSFARGEGSLLTTQDFGGLQRSAHGQGGGTDVTSASTRAGTQKTAGSDATASTETGQLRAATTSLGGADSVGAGSRDGNSLAIGNDYVAGAHGGRRGSGQVSNLYSNSEALGQGAHANYGSANSTSFGADAMKAAVLAGRSFAPAKGAGGKDDAAAAIPAGGTAPIAGTPGTGGKAPSVSAGGGGASADGGGGGHGGFMGSGITGWDVGMTLGALALTPFTGGGSGVVGLARAATLAPKIGRLLPALGRELTAAMGMSMLSDAVTGMRAASPGMSATDALSQVRAANPEFYNQMRAMGMSDEQMGTALTRMSDTQLAALQETGSFEAASNGMRMAMIGGVVANASDAEKQQLSNLLSESDRSPVDMAAAAPLAAPALAGIAAGLRGLPGLAAGGARSMLGRSGKKGRGGKAEGGGGGGWGEGFGAAVGYATSRDSPLNAMHLSRSWSQSAGASVSQDATSTTGAQLVGGRTNAGDFGVDGSIRQTGREGHESGNDRDRRRVGQVQAVASDEAVVKQGTRVGDVARENRSVDEGAEMRSTGFARPWDSDRVQRELFAALPGSSLDAAIAQGALEGIYQMRYGGAIQSPLASQQPTIRDTLGANAEAARDSFFSNMNKAVKGEEEAEAAQAKKRKEAEDRHGAAHAAYADGPGGVSKGDVMDVYGAAATNIQDGASIAEREEGRAWLNGVQKAAQVDLMQHDLGRYIGGGFNAWVNEAMTDMRGQTEMLGDTLSQSGEMPTVGGAEGSATAPVLELQRNQAMSHSSDRSIGGINVEPVAAAPMPLDDGRTGAVPIFNATTPDNDKFLATVALNDQGGLMVVPLATDQNNERLQEYLQQNPSVSMMGFTDDAARRENIDKWGPQVLNTDARLEETKLDVPASIEVPHVAPSGRDKE